MRTTLATLGLGAAGSSAVLLAVLGDPITSAPALAGVVAYGIRHRRPPFAGEAGSMLVEVMVGALVLGIATAAVLSGLDGAQDTGRKNKDRTQGSALAQQDIERLRSKPITSLSNYNETRTVQVARVDYTVVSKTEWIQDNNGVISCTDYNPFSEYLKVSSTVTSPASVNSPVKETTLLTPSPGAFGSTGTATVLLTDRDGNPRPGVGVTLSGPASYSETTNSLGCAVFRYVAAGAYTAQVSGGVSWNNEVPASAPVTVNAGKSTLNPIEVDDPASIRVRFETPTNIATDWSRITLAHAKLPAGFKVYPNDTATTRLSSIDAANLFPHLDAYGVYAGSCEANNPAFWDPDYFQPGVNGYVQLDPGDSLVSVDVTMPTVTVNVTRSVSRPARVTATQIDTAPLTPGADCTEKLADESVGPDPDGVEPFVLELPYGKYQICADDGQNRKVSTSFTSGSPRHRDLSLGSSSATNPNLTTAGTTSGPCP